MRRFSSEGSLLDLDAFPWRRMGHKTAEQVQEGCSVAETYTPHLEEPESSMEAPTPAMSSRGLGRKLKKELSVSVENITELDKAAGNLQSSSLNDSYRAYSDSQLAPDPKGSRDSVGPDRPQSPSSSRCNPLPTVSIHSNQARARLSAAKVHLKSLFSSQSPNSSHSNLATTEPQKTSATAAKERRSRLPFLRQWSQVGHSRARLSREELESWAQSLNNLLASHMGLSVFGAFLRSEFSEENLQFYLACEQYRHSSTNFSLQRRARDIIATYIQPGASREVNLSSKTRELTLQLLQAPSHTSLSIAQKHIYSLLDTDCYPRFLQSQIYNTLLQDAQ